jgi:hypothetical protein
MTLVFPLVEDLPQSPDKKVTDRYVETDPYANHVLTTMTPGTWYEYTGDTLSTLSPDPTVSLDSPLTTGEWTALSGSTQFAGITKYSGAVYSDRRKALYVNGGGHLDYHGNEWYRFNVAAMAWERVSWPDVSASYSTPDGYQDDTSRPSAYHTYSGLAYSETSDVFFRGGGSPSGVDTGLFGGAAWSYTPDTDTYTELTAQSGGNDYVYAGNLLTCWDSVNNRFWIVTRGGLWSRNPASPATPTLRLNWYTSAPYFSDFETHWSTVVHDVANELLVVLGSSKPTLIDISAPDSPSVVSQNDTWTGGGSAVARTAELGFDYDAANGENIAWIGGANIYVVDPIALTVTAEAPVGGNTVTPTSPAGGGGGGPFGRFRYVGQWGGKSCFVTFNTTTGSVYFYKRV